MPKRSSSRPPRQSALRRKAEPAATFLQEVMLTILQHYNSIDYWRLLLTCRELYILFDNLYFRFPLYDLYDDPLGVREVRLAHPLLRLQCYHNFTQPQLFWNPLKSAILLGQRELLDELLVNVRESILDCDRLAAYVYASGTLAMAGYFDIVPDQIKMEIECPRSTFRCMSLEILTFYREFLDGLSMQQLTRAVLWTIRRPRATLLEFIHAYLKESQRELDHTALPYLIQSHFPREWNELMRSFGDPSMPPFLPGPDYQAIWKTPLRLIPTPF